MIREFDVKLLTASVERMCGENACDLPDDVEEAIVNALSCEDGRHANRFYPIF